jgi:hypothetical protein
MSTRTVVAVIAALAVGLGTAAIGAVPAGAVTSPTVGETAAPGSELAPHTGHYLVRVRAGESATQSVKITNTNAQSELAKITGADALTNDATGVGFRSPLNAQALQAKWISVATPAVTLAAHESRLVSFTVRVPPGTPPGQYMAGVAAWVPLPARSKLPKAGPNQATFAIDMQVQRVIPIEIDVPGVWAAQLSVSSADAVPTAAGITLGVHMANTGNAFALGSGVIRVPDTGTDYSFKINTFLGGTSIVYPMPWVSTVPPGSHHVEVDLNYNNGRHLTWNGTIDETGAFTSGLQKQLNEVHTTTKRGAFPWLLLVALLLLLALIMGAILMRRRSHRPERVKYRAA